jgi:hypothetical protein
VTHTIKKRFSLPAAFLLALMILVMPWPQTAGAEDRLYHRLVILGDPHLPGRLIEKKEKVLEAINSWEDVDMVIAVGDICSDWGSDEEYQAAKDFFSRLKKPFFPIAGGGSIRRVLSPSPMKTSMNFWNNSPRSFYGCPAIPIPRPLRKVLPRPSMFTMAGLPISTTRI